MAGRRVLTGAAGCARWGRGAGAAAGGRAEGHDISVAGLFEAAALSCAYTWPEGVASIHARA